MAATIRLSPMVARVRSAWTEMSYAQRRTFENQTGITLTTRGPAIARTAAELEALYARDR